MNPFKTNKLKEIKCLITDIDGVLTDGLLHIANDGNETKTFHVHDGMGLKLLMAAGIHVAVITTSKNNVIDLRMAQLGIKHYYKGEINKETSYSHLKKTLSLSDDECCYIGDDLPDIPILEKAGVAFSVNDALPQVKNKSDFISEKNGGRGAVREICNMILDAQNKADYALEQYLNGKA
jgi:3-deoxy-D-manno-octulosonate 8-phosphate phosphatase (KDO 8-P phosphatase)